MKGYTLGYIMSMSNKRRLIWGRGLLLLLLTVLLPSCSKEMDEGYFSSREDDKGTTSEATADYQSFSAIVTSKLSPSGEVYFQVTENETVYPANFSSFGYSFDRPRRIVCELVVFDRQYGNLGNYALIDWMEFVQEGPVQTAGKEGEDGVEVLDDWMTSLEDGFLTLHFSTWWGVQQKRHELLLIVGENPDDPYEMRLEHHSNGDPKSMQADALVCFDLAGRLPVPADPAHTFVTLQWRNDAGEIIRRQFPYSSRD